MIPNLPPLIRKYLIDGIAARLPNPAKIKPRVADVVDRYSAWQGVLYTLLCEEAQPDELLQYLEGLEGKYAQTGQMRTDAGRLETTTRDLSLRMALGFLPKIKPRGVTALSLSA